MKGAAGRETPRAEEKDENREQDAAERKRRKRRSKPEGGNREEKDENREQDAAERKRRKRKSKPVPEQPPLRVDESRPGPLGEDTSEPMDVGAG